MKISLISVAIAFAVIILIAFWLIRRSNKGSVIQKDKAIPVEVSEYKAPPGSIAHFYQRLRAEEATWSAAEIEGAVRSQDNTFPERVSELLQHLGVKSLQELCRLYLQATAEQRIFIRSKTDRAHRDKLLRFSEQAAILGVQQKSEDTIRLGLVALVIENATVDPRDTVLYAGALQKAAIDIGSDPETLLREAAKIASQTLSEFLLGTAGVDVR